MILKINYLALKNRNTMALFCCSFGLPDERIALYLHIRYGTLTGITVQHQTCDEDTEEDQWWEEGPYVNFEAIPRSIFWNGKSHEEKRSEARAFVDKFIQDHRGERMMKNAGKKN